MKWIRNRPTARENAAAALAGVMVGGVLGTVIFYVGRLVLARDPIRPPGELAGELEPPTDEGGEQAS